MSLHAQLRSATPFIDADIAIDDGSCVAIIGRNGAGKSTLLRLIAGLLVPESGRLDIAGETYVDDCTFTAPHRRPVAMLGQRPLLFPHLDVAANIAYGPRAARCTRAQVRDRVQRWAEATKVTELLDRRPRQLSGGQAQRVALARALACEPAVLLLDEPFAALDIDAASALRALVSEVLSQHDRTAMIVTHDLVDIATLADAALVIEDGYVIDSGPVASVLSRPASTFTARLAGVNVLAGRLHAGVLHVSDLDCGDVGFAGVLDDGVTASELQRMIAIFQPSAVTIVKQSAVQSNDRNILNARITEISPLGSRALVRSSACGTQISAEVAWGDVAELGLVVGAQITLSVRASQVSIYPSRAGDGL